MVAQALLAAIGISAEVWKKLHPDQKKKIKAQFEKGAVGMAKIITNRAKKAIPKRKQKSKGKKHGSKKRR